MNYRPRVVLCSWAVVYGLTSACLAASITFDSGAVNPPDQFGAAFGTMPTAVVLREEGIDMSVEEFFLRSFVGFSKAEVVPPSAGLFTTNALSLDNISVLFDFSGLSFDVTQVSIEFREGGGENNFDVNRFALITPLMDITDLVGEIAPDITVSVTGQTVTLLAQNQAVIDSVLIGGQELVIDNIMAVPEPSSVVLVGLAAVFLLRRRARGPRLDVG